MLRRLLQNAAQGYKWTSATAVPKIRINAREYYHHHHHQKRSFALQLSSVSLLGWLGLKKESQQQDAEKNPTAADLEKLTDTIRLGILAVKDGSNDKAETILHSALRMAQDLNSDDGVTYVYAILANLAFYRVWYIKALWRRS